MSNTGYYPRKGECSIAPTEVLAGIVHDESARAMSYPVGHAGLFSTGTDLEYFMQAWIKGGAILQEETIKKSITTQVQGNDLAMGLGWHIDELKYLGHKTPTGTFLHPGFTGTLIGGSKEHDFYFVIITNSVYPKRQDPEKKNHFFRSLFDIIFE